MSKVIIVMPAYYAEKTLRATYDRLPKVFDEVILCDDGSGDKTFALSTSLGITTLRHEKNKGYGGNQKTLYNVARTRGADIVIMVHPDNQYDTKCLPEMIRVIQEDGAAMVLGTRMRAARENGMPAWKYAGNRLLTILQNTTFRTELSEFHSGLRAYRADVFYEMPYEDFSDNFVFDSEVIAWLISRQHLIREVTTDCYYTRDVSSTSLRQSVRYGLATLKTLMRYRRGFYNYSRKI